MKKLCKSLIAASTAIVCAFSATALPLSGSSAEQVLLGYKGDVNQDASVNSADLVRLSSHIQRNELLDSD